MYKYLVRARYLSLLFHSFNFIPWSDGSANLRVLFFFFFVDYYQIWSPGRDLVIRLYLEISVEFMRLILFDRFCFVHIPFVHMVKLQLLAQFPVDHVPTLSCQVFYSFCANLLLSLIMQLINIIN